MKPIEKIIKAKIKLQSENPFFSYLISHLKIKELDEDTKKALKEHLNQVPTMCVDNLGNLYYADEFIKSLNDEELKGVLCHETLHIAFEHLIRVRERDKRLWNIATDLCINDLLITNNFTLCKNGLIPDEGHKFEIKNGKKTFILNDIDKKSAERIYDDLYNVLDKSQREMLDKSRFDTHIFSKNEKDMSEKERKEFNKAKKLWKNALVEAGNLARMRGKLPLGIERIIGELLEEKLNWKSLLYKYITNEIPFDYNWNFPSKRSQALGIYLPSLKKEKVEVVVSIDTSGSISQKELTEFVTEIVAIAKSFNNLKITCIVCDAEIQDVLVCENGNIDTILDMKVKGGGGTSHIPIYEYIKENIPLTKILINFTDGYTEFPNEENVKTIWIIAKGGTEDSNIPFGTIIRLED